MVRGRGGCVWGRRCLYKPRRPFKDFLDRVLQGAQGPATPQQAAAFVPQAEPGVDNDDSDLYSDDGEADMEVDLPPPVSAAAAAAQQLLARDGMPAAAEANGAGPGPAALEEAQEEEDAQPPPEEQQAAPQQQQPGQQAQAEQAEGQQQQEQAMQAAEAGGAGERPAVRGIKRLRGNMRKVG